MGDLKPIGSEKLQGQEKINRILEIARYKESTPSSMNESESSEYSINLADGNNYQIVKERMGYIIKKTISESETEYIEPIKNRKYYNSYSQAFKRLNLMAKETNELYDNEEGISLFGEQKKFVLKTPKPEVPDMDMAAPEPSVPEAPPSVPSLELPPSDVGAPTSDELSLDGGDELPSDDSSTEDSAEVGSENMDSGATYKTIQKLTGKLTQKIREYDEIKGLTSEEIKYVLNMVISSLDLKNLSGEDKDDILSKFDEDEEDIDNEDMSFGDEESVDIGDENSEIEEPSLESEMEENSYGGIIDSIFKESKVDKVLEKYFDVTESEKKTIKEFAEVKKKRVGDEVRAKMVSVKKLTETFEQELASKKFLEENSNYRFIGKTNKNNLVFEDGKNQIRITPQGIIK